MKKISMLLSIVLLAVLSCCAPKKAAHIERIYEGLAEKYDAFSARVLEGKKIAIDPGHGGFFAGTIGQDSLREADANLGVALYLWGLCVDAGARTIMTRTADRDLLPQGSSDAREDLLSRITIANEFEPDVFISIHHNSNLERDPSQNRIEVYYRAEDPEASLELAQAVQMHLSKNLGIREAYIKPGNYLVLRNCRAQAAVLGEASYLSHPLVENRLRLAEKQKLEAYAYFFALVDYFSRGVPELARLSPLSDTISSPGEIAFTVNPAASVPLDPSSARISIDGSSATVHFDADSSVMRCFMDPELPNGIHRVRATIRSARGATSSRAFDILLARPARHVIALPRRQVASDTSVLSIRVLDELASPVADRTPVKLQDSDGKEIQKSTTRKGLAEFAVPGSRSDREFLVSIENLTQKVSFPLSSEEELISIQVLDARSKKVVRNPIVLGSDFSGAMGDTSGYVLVPARLAGRRVTIAARGYESATVDIGSENLEASRPPVFLLEPVLGGTLAGKRIALDAWGGGSQSSGYSRSGLRGATLSLAICKALRDLLEQAGACVSLTRTGEETLSQEERIFVVNRSRAHLALSIRCEEAQGSSSTEHKVLHYPGSKKGNSAAVQISKALSLLDPERPFEIAESADLFLQQTSCPAAVICLATFPKDTSAFSNLDWTEIRRAAELIRSAIADWFRESSED